MIVLALVLATVALRWDDVCDIVAQGGPDRDLLFAGLAGLFLCTIWVQVTF